MSSNAPGLRLLAKGATALALFVLPARGRADAAPAGEVARAAARSAAPLIERVAPSAGPPGTLVRISGRHLRGQTRVRVGQTGLAIEVGAPNLITARIPKDATTGVLQVETEAGSAAGPVFHVTSPPAVPVLERVVPARAVAGTRVTLHGSGFSVLLSQDDVRFGDVPAVIERATPTELSVIVPDRPGPAQISLQVEGAGEAQRTLHFDVVAGLSIREVVPLSAAPGDRLQILGSGFDPRPQRDRVALGERPLRVLEASATRLLVELPQAAQTGRVRVATAAQGEVLSPAEIDVVYPPTIEGITPSAGAPGTWIRMKGQGFGRDPDAVEVRLGDQVLQVRSVTPHELVVEVPAAACSGKLSVRVGGFGPASFDAVFEVTGRLHVVRMTPQAGPPGTEVAIEGSGFASRPSDNRVRFQGAAADAQVLSSSPTQLRVRVPEATTGPVQIAVGGSEIETAAPFVVTQPPRIATVSALQWIAGRAYTIAGSGFGQTPALIAVSLAGERLAVKSVREDAIVVLAPARPLRGELTVHVALQGQASFERPIEVRADRSAAR